MEMLLLFRVYHIEHVHRFTEYKKMCSFCDLQWCYKYKVCSMKFNLPSDCSIYEKLMK